MENRRLLPGESLSNDAEDDLRETAAGVEGVAEVVGLRTVYFGPEGVVVTADVGVQAGMSGCTTDDTEAVLKRTNSDVNTVYVEAESDEAGSVDAGFDGSGDDTDPDPAGAEPAGSDA